MPGAFTALISRLAAVSDLMERMLAGENQIASAAIGGRVSR